MNDNKVQPSSSDNGIKLSDDNLQPPLNNANELNLNQDNVQPSSSDNGIKLSDDNLQPSLNNANELNLNQNNVQPASSENGIKVSDDNLQPPLNNANELNLNQDNVQPASSENGIKVSDDNQPTNSNPVTQSNGKTSNKFIPKIILIVIALIVIIGGGGAIAYVSAILPNEPQNVLKTALFNSLEQTQISSKGDIQVSAHSIDGKLVFNNQANIANKSADLNLNLTISGINLPVEIRFLNDSAYFKIGNIANIANLLGSVNPQMTKTINALSSKISNQWFYVDSTIINEIPQAKCILNSNLRLTPQNLQPLQNIYSQNKFVKIVSTSNTQLNGVSVQKMNLLINDSKITSFLSGLEQLSIFKTIKGCSNGSLNQSSVNSVSSKISGTTELSVWINTASKQIDQISGSSSPSSSNSYSYLIDFSYQPVNIVAPSSSEPITNLMSLMSSMGGGLSGPVQTPLL